MMAALVKPCTRCGEVKPVDEFYRRSDRPAGRASMCKLCYSGASAAARRATAESPCGVAGCGRGQSRQGLCQSHYKRFRSGDPDWARPVKTHAPPGAGNLHPSGYRRMEIGGKGVFEHTLVMQAALGRRLRPGENIHHRNGDRLDNRLENLELWSTRQPKGQRVSDKFEWAKQMIEEYGCRYLLGNGPELGPVYCEKFADGHDFCAEHRSDEGDADA